MSMGNSTPTQQMKTNAASSTAGGPKYKVKTSAGSQTISVTYVKRVMTAVRFVIVEVKN